MNTQNKENRLYVSPVIHRIELDNEISLTLDSVPPGGPGEAQLKVSEYFNNNPFHSNLG
jgi:hypothetical protein